MLFDRIVVVDWSASNSPTTGADSVWIADASPDGIELTNPPTRRAALEQIGAVATRSGQTLLGVDFSLGFPTGTAEALGLVGAPWRAMSELLGSEITDDDRNRNNRFEVASRLNDRIGGGQAPGPFWGCPPGKRTPYLGSTKPPIPTRRPPEWRHVETRLRDEGLRPFSAWQLLGVGAVGSQSLVGIAALERLRWNVGRRLRVWPFDTGFTAALDDSDDALVIAEIWPSRWPVDVPPGMIKDAAQVQATAQRLTDMDATGMLAAWFTPTIEPAARDAVLTEEGWVLGVA